MATAQLWLFAGPNGAGKTTFTKRETFSQHISHFLNADELTRQLLNEQGFPTYATAPADVLLRSNLAAAEKVFPKCASCLPPGRRWLSKLC
ncbi:MAG: hypothetical protein HOP33_09715 [Verrucomicrobia bacterium]|nr:hypothetical protein [Verrucomicrobiota bacterium]